MRVKMQDCRKATAAYFGLQQGQLRKRGQSFKMAHPRQIAMAVAREVTGASLPEIGDHFGGLDHTTAIHAVRAAHKRIREDEELALDYWMIERLAHSIAVERVAWELAMVHQMIEAGELIPAPDYVPLLEYHQEAAE